MSALVYKITREMDSSRGHRITWVLFLAWCGLLTAVLYGPTIPLPPFFDDFVHYPFVAANNIREIWFTLDELPYYRPLQSTLWSLTYVLSQGHAPAVDRSANLLLHAANGALVGILSFRLWQRAGSLREIGHARETPDWWRVWLSATLFLLFPFSYQAVPWIGSFGHILVTTLILLSVLAYVQMRRTGRKLWGAASLFFALLAPFAHENGVLIMPLVVVVELTTPDAPQRWRRALTAGLVWSLPYLIYLPIWFSLPRLASDALFPNNIEGLLQNSAYFLQGAVYPLTGLGGWLYDQWQVNDMVAVAGLSGLGIALAAAIQLKQRATLRSLLPWLWWLLAVLPAIPFLLFEYVINGPRLLMVASVGIVWLWSDVALLFVRGAARRSRGRLLRTAVAALALVLLLFQNARFVRERISLHQVLGSGFAQVIEATSQANDQGHRAVIVNMPSWLAPVRSDFALGHDGVLFWPDYVPHAMLLAVHNGELGQLSFVRVDAVSPDPQDIYFGLTGPPADWPALLSTPAEVLQAEFTAAGVRLLPVGGITAPEGSSTKPTATYLSEVGQGVVRLEDARAQVSDDAVRVDLLWEVQGTMDDITVFVHLVDDQGQLLAQADGDLLGGSLPLASWAGGPLLTDTRWLDSEGATAAKVLIGLYNRQSGVRLRALNSDGSPLSDDALALGISGP